MSLKRFLAAVAVTVLAAAGSARADEVTVFAAASATNAMNEVGDMFKAATGHTIRPSYASSSTLAKQIEQGAPANVFLSADLQWADYLSQRKLIITDSRVNLLGNVLVLVAASDSPMKSVGTVDKTTDLPGLLGQGRLSTGDPDHVPVGIYARKALQSMGQWTAIEPRLARAESVRAALALVERGEAPLGIVYATDAAISKKVKVVGTFDERLHDPVVYPVALVTGHDTDAAKQLMAFLQTPAAKGVFAKYGFKLN